MPQLVLQIKGAQEIKRKLQQLTQLAPRAVAQALYLEGNNIMSASKRLVPVDLGALKSSGYVTLPQADLAGRITVELGYGGPAADYAVVQHERLDFQHPDGGEAKYLERPLDERAPGIPRRVAALARAAIERMAQTPAITAGANPRDPWEAPAAAAIGRALKAFGKAAGFAAPRRRRK